jgi:glycine cleavage system H protein
MTPEDRHFTREHEWVVSLDNGNIKVGITDYAQDALGDVVFVALPDVGADLQAGEACGEVESTKSVSEVYSPVSGTVVERNDAVETAPETVNADPYGDGWLFVVRPREDSSPGDLLSAGDYEALIQAI